MIDSFITATLAVSLAAAPQPVARPCLSDQEAEAVTSVALPDLIRETGRICSPVLPPAALVRQEGGPLLAKYEAEADRVWPVARAAIVKLSDPLAAPLLDLQLARPLLTSLLIPLLVGKIDTRDCGTIDRLVTQLAPLPARNTAGIVVTALQFLKAKKARKKTAMQDVPDLPLCTAAS